MSNVGTLDTISSKTINTKFGPKLKYSVKIDGTWYDAGWKKPTVSEGTTVQFEFKDGTYGKELTTGLTPAVAGLGAGTSVAAKPAGTDKPRGKFDAAPFPVPALDPSRSIIRQNALRHATATWDMTARSNSNERIGEPSGTALRVKDVAGAVIAIARIYENYISGYDDMADAAKEVEAGDELIEALKAVTKGSKK